MKTQNLTQKLNFYELIGVILGDGCIKYYPSHKVYTLEITGDAKDDQEYFSKLSKLITSITNKTPTVRISIDKKKRALRLELHSKKFLEFLLNDVGITNKKKSFNAEIPKKYLEWKYSKHIIRGIFETDGSLYFSKSKKIKYTSYPRIEIKTSSKKLALQIFELLKQKAFKVQKRPSKTDKTIRVYLSGSEMLNKWLKEIGFSSMKKYSKYLFWKKFGYYIPKTPYKKRMILIREHGQVAKASACRADIRGFKSLCSLL
jgi:hypothetical protein